jgi:hypothetical protein
MANKTDNKTTTSVTQQKVFGSKSVTQQKVFGSNKNAFKFAEDDGQSAIYINEKDKSGGKGLFAYPVIFTSISIRLGERVQVIESFNDAVHLNAFGKNAAVLSLAGHVIGSVKDNDGQEKTGSLLIKNYDNNIRAFEAAKKGKLITISTHMGIVYSGVCTALDFSHDASLRAISNFNMNFVIISNIMGVT